MESADDVDHRPMKSSISGGRFDGNSLAKHSCILGHSISYKTVLGLHSAS